MSPSIALDNEFDAPPDYVAAWLTDYREDDPRWFGGTGTAKVTKSGKQVFLEADNPIGRAKTIVTLETPTRWSAVGETWKGGKVVMKTHIVETVQPKGAGTRHHVEIQMEGQTVMMRIMLAIMKPMLRGTLSKGFAKMRPEISAQWKAGKPPTA